MARRRGATIISGLSKKAVTHDFKGGPELEAALEGLQKKTAVKILRRSVAQGGEIVRKEMSRLAPRGSAADREGKVLHQNILKKGRLRFKKSKGVNAPTVVSQIGPSADVFHGTFLEVGTSRGIDSRPFIRPALDNKVSQVITKILDTVRKGIDSAARRAKKGRR